MGLQGKMDGFDWREEKNINDAEWQKIYKSICAWSKSVAGKGTADTTNLPENDFDLLKQFYPQLSFRDLETPFIADEVGNSFPYANMKDLLSAAVQGSLSIPGVADSGTSLEAVEVKASLANLKETSMKKIDDIYADAMTFAKNPFPDDEARDHYKKLASKLADFPQGADGWAKFRANMEKEVDEMARLASKKVEHGHGHNDNAMSPAQEFEQKFGKSGLDVWKKSQEFSSNLEAMSEADKNAVEK